MEENQTEVGLPFHDKKQEAIVGWMFSDPKFFMQCKGLVKPEWFKDPHVSKIYAAQLKWYKSLNRVPTVEEIRYSPDLMAEEPGIRVKLQSKVSECITQTQYFFLDALAGELTKWLRSRIFHTAAYEAKTVYNNERYEDAYATMEKALKEIKEASFIREREASFANPIEEIQNSREEIKHGLTFGLKTIDDLLLPGNTGGALLRGDTSIILAPTNVGKTTTLLTVVGANIKKGKRILLLTHEGRPMDIKEKLWKNQLGVTTQDLFDLPDTEQGRKALYMVSERIERNLVYVPYNKAGLTVEEVEALIRRKQEEAVAKYGEGFDLLVSDYPAKLTTEGAKKGNITKRTIDEIVYGYFIQLALEYNFHALLAIQTNREGARVNKNQRDERRLLVMEDVHESYGVMQEATNVITLNRDAVAKARGRMTFHIDKSRSSETGFAVVAKTDFARAKTHSDQLGSIWYRGASTLADQVDDLLADPENNGQEIDATQFVGN